MNDINTKQERIRWTSSQRELVVAAFVNIIKTDLPEYKMKHAEDFVSVSFIRSNIGRAQQVLNRCYHRQHFAREQLQQFNVDVSMMWWRMQLAAEKQTLLLEGAPMDALIEELARRQSDSLLERLLDRLEGPLMQRLSARLDSMAAAHFKLIEDRVKHNPVADSGEKVALPSYVVIGLLGDQQHELEKHFNSATHVCNFTFLDTSAKGRVADVCKNRIVFCSRFTNHSHSEVAKKVAAKAVFINGHLNEMKRLIQVNINEFNQLHSK